MLKPPLVFLHVAMLIDDPVTSWPELGQVRTVDAEEELKTYETFGGHILGLKDGPCVVSLPEGSEHALHLLTEELYDSKVMCISVRRSPGVHFGWWARLETAAKEHGITVVNHDRHDVLEAVAYRLFTDGLRAIEDSADLLRSEGIQTSNEAMRTEMALSKAIQTIRATGFRAPKVR